MHGDGSQERFFEFALDFVSLLIDGKQDTAVFLHTDINKPRSYVEVPKELKKASLLLLGSMHSELTSVPAMFHSRVKRIMPFLTHNVYLANTGLASSMLGLPPTNDPQQQQQHLEMCLEQSKPWEWLEDYVSEPPHDNDAPISLSLFNARKLKRVDNTYVRWFKFGFDEGPLSMRRKIEDGPSHISTLDKNKNKKDESLDENGFIFIVDDDEDVENASKAVSSGSSSRKRKVEMEEGELP